MTQTWLADDGEGDRPAYEAVYCLACSKQHLISTATGRSMGDSAAAVTVTHGPIFPPNQRGERALAAQEAERGRALGHSQSKAR